MKATGIVRRIDDLGRVVIPKEIRRTLRIREGDPLEIFTDREGEVILKKYSPIGELGTLAKLYAESLSQTMGCTVCITDTDQVVASAGSGRKELQDQFIGQELGRAMKERSQILARNGDISYIKVTADMVKRLVVKVFDEPIVIIFHLQIHNNIGIFFEIDRLHLQNFCPQCFQLS